MNIRHSRISNIRSGAQTRRKTAFFQYCTIELSEILYIFSELVRHIATLKHRHVDSLFTVSDKKDHVTNLNV